jgi:hypothetical protein
VPKLVITLKRPPSLVEIENLPAGFDFYLTCSQARVNGFFQTGFVHIAYDNISILTLQGGQDEIRIMPVEGRPN